MQIGINKKDIIHTLRYKVLDAWISPLKWLADEVKEQTNMPHSKIVCIPLGIETENLLSQSVGKEQARNFWGIKSNMPLIGIIGRLDIQKNQHLLIEAAKILKDRDIIIDLLIVGEPTRDTEHLNYSKNLRDMVQKFNMEDHVHFHPFTNKITTFYEALDIFVMATNKETYGMVTLESMLLGTPVIASNAGGTPEILGYGKFGTLFESGNAKDLAEKIMYALENKEIINEKAQSANKIVLQKFDYRSECKQITELIKSTGVSK
jgi:glycosyltransferase involved in cell wall biosynthesis